MRGFESLILCQNKPPPNRVVVLFWQKIRIGIRTNLNADVRWTSARFRLDGIDTIIESNPSSSAIRFPLDSSESRGFFLFFPLLLFRMFWISKADFCFPLSAYGFDDAFRAVYAVFLHLFSYMAVGIQGRGGCTLTFFSQIGLERYYEILIFLKHFGNLSENSPD